MTFDGVVIGGGPAGMFAAITAASFGQKVLLVERNDRLGKKLLITGKGRCNVTNHCSAQEVLNNIPRNGRFLYSAMNTFSPEDIITYFQTRNCPLKTERGNRVFPVSDKAISILDCLKRDMRALGVEVINDRVQKIAVQDGRVTSVYGESASYDCDWAILATGGVSYPATGSTGDGYKIAMELGHTVISPEGSLVPLTSDDPDCAAMQGLSLRNVGVRMINGNGKQLYKDFGELLFTHFGISGPTVLSASAHLTDNNCCFLIDLKPALEESKLDERILRDLEQYRNRTMENALTDLLPRSMIPVVLRKLAIPTDLPAHSLRKEQRRAIVTLLKAFPVRISGKRPVAEAIITSGGIRTSEIDPKTMESKLIKGLYFAGEIIDCDAYTGGFNLQIAWATAYAAGSAVGCSW